MSTTIRLSGTRAAGPAATGRGSLLRAEWHRFTARRLVRALLALAVLGVLAGVVVALFTFAKPTPALLDQARTARAAVAADQEQYRQQCLQTVGQPGGQAAAEDCGEAMAAEDFGDLDGYLPKHPFTLVDDAESALLGLAALTAAVLFLVGATFVGAEWSSRSMVALLFWEPRRWRVLGAKLAVALAAGAVVAVVLGALGIGGVELVAALRGSTAAPHGLWGHLVALSGRGVALSGLAAAFGFGIANLLRGTAASLGFGFLYFAVVENVLRNVAPAAQPWLVTENAIALVHQGGYHVYIPAHVIDAQGRLQQERLVTISNLHGGLYLAALAVVLLALGAFVFHRRDIS